jgi:hypothetical protein
MDLTGILELLVIALSWGITIAVGLVTALVIYARWYYGTLENTPGLTGVVEPYFVGGSNPYTYKEVICLKDKENAREYGPIYGVGNFETRLCNQWFILILRECVRLINELLVL